jgi:hypothetical protein
MQISEQFELSGQKNHPITRKKIFKTMTEWFNKQEEKIVREKGKVVAISHDITFVGLGESYGIYSGSVIIIFEKVS